MNEVKLLLTSNEFKTVDAVKLSEYVRGMNDKDNGFYSTKQKDGWVSWAKVHVTGPELSEDTSGPVDAQGTTWYVDENEKIPFLEGIREHIVPQECAVFRLSCQSHGKRYASAFAVTSENIRALTREQASRVEKSHKYSDIDNPRKTEGEVKRRYFDGHPPAVQICSSVFEITDAEQFKKLMHSICCDVIDYHLSEADGRIYGSFCINGTFPKGVFQGYEYSGDQLIEKKKEFGSGIEYMTWYQHPDEDDENSIIRHLQPLIAEGEVAQIMLAGREEYIMYAVLYAVSCSSICSSDCMDKLNQMEKSLKAELD